MHHSSWCCLLLIGISVVFSGHFVNGGKDASDVDVDSVMDLKDSSDWSSVHRPVSPEEASALRVETGFTPTHLHDIQLPCHDFHSEECALRFLQEYDSVMSRNEYVANTASFATKLDIENVEKAKINERISHELSQTEKKATKLALKFSFQSFSPIVKRQFHFLTFGSAHHVNATVSRRMLHLKNLMHAKYSQANPCPEGFSKCLGPGEFPIVQFMQKETDYDRLAAAWKAWTDLQGRTLKPFYTEFVKVSNIEPRLNGLRDAGYREWFLDMQSPQFDSYVWGVMEEVMPLYRELHAYVRARLRQFYPNRFAADDPIPAHLLGNIWAQQWPNIYPRVKPYPNAKSYDVNAAFKKLPVPKLVRMAEEFFTSLGLPPMTRDFWRNSVFVKKPQPVMDCHAGARDIGNGEDFRITMCGTSSKATFQTIHHEMGHIQYFMHYSPWNIPFRSGANSGFHEAIGDTIGLAVVTPAHLEKVGILENVPVDEELDINNLMEMALEKVAFIPFGLLVDVWRWRVFNGTTPEQHYNRDWWKLRMELQGLMPPEKRDESTADALFKYHIASNVPYIRYFLSFVMQFQFYEALCDASGYKGVLHRCDFYNSKEAGEKLSSMLRIGMSKPWEDSMEAITGQRKLSTRSILRYFKPLHDWLKKENKRLNVPVGWKIRNDLLP